MWYDASPILMDDKTLTEHQLQHMLIEHIDETNQLG